MVTSRSVALVTGRAFLKADDDLPLATAALETCGVGVEIVCWDDGDVRWDRFDGAVVFSTWDYVDCRDEFLAWAGRVASSTVLANPPAVLRWNTDKRYLCDLAQAGVPVVPTRYVAPGDDVGSVTGWPDVVVKPTVSAGARHTGRFRDEPVAAAAFVRRLLADGHHVMVQPYLDAIDTSGELSVCVFGGVPSHVLRKQSLLRPGVDPVPDHSLGETQLVVAAELAAAPLDLVGQVLAAVPSSVSPGANELNTGRLLFARIDCATGPDGLPVVIEAELTEPSFFLTRHPAGAERFALAVVEWLSGVHRYLP